MKKRIIKLLTIFTALLTLCISFSACGGNHNAIDNSPESTVNGDSKTLVAYFSWSGNGQQTAICLSQNERDIYMTEKPAKNIPIMGCAFSGTVQNRI